MQCSFIAPASLVSSPCLTGSGYEAGGRDYVLKRRANQIWVFFFFAIMWLRSLGQRRETPCDRLPPNSRWREARSLDARAKAADSSIKRVGELLVCAAVRSHIGQGGVKY